MWVELGNSYFLYLPAVSKVVTNANRVLEFVCSTQCSVYSTINVAKVKYIEVDDLLPVKQKHFYHVLVKL